MPVELIRAAGWCPCASRLCLAHHGGRCLHRAHRRPDVRWIFELYCTGALDALDLLIIPRSTESQHKLFLSIREACAPASSAPAPELWLYDIPHTQRASSAAYGLDRTARWRIAWAPWPVSRCLRPACSKPLPKATSAASCWPSCRPCAGPALLRRRGPGGQQRLALHASCRGRARLAPVVAHTGGPQRLAAGPGLLVRGCRWSMDLHRFGRAMVRASWPRTTTGVHVPASP